MDSRFSGTGNVHGLGGSILPADKVQMQKIGNSKILVVKKKAPQSQGPTSQAILASNQATSSQALSLGIAV
jgi:hypothetical protein